ncbi:MAG: hypothetical protein KJO34_04475 [Deltaproteobacteria bacterium]|nr:hypothetical protein [Deltaproteobacteria bacterium]
MTLTITTVDTKPKLKEWVQFPFMIYANDRNFVPQLVREEMDFFSPERNPCFLAAETKLLMARRNGKTVGRVCGIIHGLEEAKLGYRRGRFGWFECIDDHQVAVALLGHLQEWFIKKKCREITGPQGFSDLDPEGLLIEGFDALPTIAGSYNKPYYRRLLENFGFQKEIDYIENRVKVPESTPLLRRIAKNVSKFKLDGYRAVTFTKKKEVLAYVDQWWDVIDASFENLYGVTPLTDAQKAYYTKKYFGYIDPRFVHFVTDRSQRLAGIFLGLPSLSRPFQKANGRLFPFGFINILNGFKNYDTVDFYLAGIHPSANARKVFPIMVLGMYRALKAKGVKYIETNRELETNTTITGIWTKFSIVNRRRSRIFKKPLIEVRQ